MDYTEFLSKFMRTIDLVNMTRLANCLLRDSSEHMLAI
jgi:hypothetical protein